MSDSAHLFGALDNEATSQELARVLDFEIRLAKASLTRAQTRDDNIKHNPTVLGEYPMLEGHPESWARYISNVMLINVNDTEAVTVYDVNFFKVNCQSIYKPTYHHA